MIDRQESLFSLYIPFLIDDTLYRPCRLFLPIPITSDTSNNRPDYAYSRYIGTALIYVHMYLRTCMRIRMQVQIVVEIVGQVVVQIVV